MALLNKRTRRAVRALIRTYYTPWRHPVTAASHVWRPFPISVAWCRAVPRVRILGTAICITRMRHMCEGTPSHRRVPSFRRHHILLTSAQSANVHLHPHITHHTPVPYPHPSHPLFVQANDSKQKHPGPTPTAAAAAAAVAVTATTNRRLLLYPTTHPPQLLPQHSFASASAAGFLFSFAFPLAPPVLLSPLLASQ